MQGVANFRNCSNDQLMEELHAHRGDERRSCVRVVRILEEVERRRLFAELGYPSLFQFCVSALHMSEHEAYLRLNAARIGRRFPVILQMLESGELHLTAIKLLAPHLTEENGASLIGAAVHKTKRQVEEMLAARFPRPAVGESIRRLPASAQVSASARAPTASAEAAPGASAVGRLYEPKPTASAPPLLEQPAPAIDRPAAVPSVGPLPAPVTQTRRESIEPLSPERYAVRFTASARCRELIDRAKELMSHRSPNADVAELVEAGLEALVEKLEKQKFKKTSRPRPQKKKAKGRPIPAEVARVVHERDGGRCTYVGPGGHRCNARAFLEFDHILSVTRGGQSTVENLRLRCRVHNQLTACHELGEDYVTLRAQGFRPVSGKKKQKHRKPGSIDRETAHAKGLHQGPPASGDTSRGVSELDDRGEPSPAPI